MSKEKESQPISRLGIVGVKGKIGTVLQEGLKGYEITSLDLPEIDVRNYTSLVEKIGGLDAVIHLALNPNRDEIRENARNDVYDPDNSLMNYNVYKTALETGVKRVIMASSVHADNFYKWEGPGKLAVDNTPHPTTPYGANKVFMEALGRYYASQGLEVVCIRFGGVNPANKPPKDDFYENAVWLSHEDCVAIMNVCLKAEKIPNNFVILYAVSNNKDKIHDTSNPFGWTPK